MDLSSQQVLELLIATCWSVDHLEATNIYQLVL